jgi:hypothetical protein
MYVCSALTLQFSPIIPADDDKKQPPDLYKRNSFCVYALFDIYTISKKSNTKTVG